MFLAYIFHRERLPYYIINFFKRCRKVHYRRRQRFVMEGGIVIGVTYKLSRAIDHVQRAFSAHASCNVVHIPTTSQHANCHLKLLKERILS